MVEPADNATHRSAEGEAVVPGEARVPSPADAEPKRSKPALRLAGLEGPRGIACLSVIMVHVSGHFTPNVLATARLDFLGQGLSFFFALSGFLLYLPYVKRLSERREMLPTRAYFRHRLVRVFPAYLVIFLICNFVLRAVYTTNAYLVAGKADFEGTGMMTEPLDVLAQLTLTQSLFPSTLQTGINPAWSLTTEWGFYLSLPIFGIVLFAAAAKGRVRRPFRAALWPPLILFAIGVTTNAIVGVLQHEYYPGNILEGYWGDNWVAVLSRSFLSLSDTFAFGMVAAVIYVALTKGELARWSTARLQVAAGAVMMAGLLSSFALFVLSPRYLSTTFALASAALIVLIVTPLARGEKSSLAAITDWRPMKYVGTISLSAYLWHFPVLIVVHRLGLSVPDNAFGVTAAFVIVSVLTIAVGSITYRWVEVPAMRYR